MQRQTRNYTENYPVLDITALHQKGFIHSGRQGISSAKVRDRQVWAFSWHIDTDLILVEYRQHDEDYQHRVTLERQSVHCGGVRYFVRCPCCNARRKQLYIKCGSIGCRQCQKLHYRSQSESHHEREYRKLDRLLAKVHNFGYRFDGHWKAKWQRWKTFHLLDEQIEQTQQSILNQVSKRFGFDVTL